MTFIASEIIEPTSERFAGRISVLPVLASSPKFVMYCSATRSWTASYPPVDWIELGDLADPLGGGGRPREDRGGLTLGLVDALLAVGFGRFDDLLLLAFGAS